jgi:hypothetical protein
VDRDPIPSTFTTPPPNPLPSDSKTPRQAFLKLPTKDIAEPPAFTFQWGKQASKKVEWDILGNDEAIDLGTPDVSSHKATEEISFEDDMDLSDLFFEKMFPCIKGHGKLMDKYLADERVEFHSTFVNESIIFHDEDAEDPDWKINQCYTLLIVAASEMEMGVDNLWKKGKSNDSRDHPDFGEYMRNNQFKAFKSGAHFCWCDESIWFDDKRDLTWDVFSPCLEIFNAKRVQLIKTMALLLDETMAMWVPTTTKTGGLPKLTYERRRPVPLGAMFHNFDKVTTVISVYQSVVQHAKVTKGLEYFGDRANLPNNESVVAHTAEVLRQVEGVKVVEGG